MTRRQKTCVCGGGCTSIAPRGWLANQVAMASRGFEAVVGRATEGFCCPLCARELPSSCASVADCPAKAVGGRPLTLLCKRCNNLLGQEYESEAAALLHGQVPGEPWTQVLPVKFGRKNGPITFHKAKMVHRPGEPSIEMEPLGEFTDYMRQAAGDESLGPFTLQFTPPSEPATKLAYLSWAFLALFSRFGYAYALGRSARPVREALLRNAQPTFGRFFFLIAGEPAVPLPAPRVVFVCRRIQLLRQWQPITLGVAFGNATLLVPMAGDPMGDRIRVLDSHEGPGYELREVAVPILFERWWPRENGTSHLGDRCSFQFQMPDGSLLPVVQTSPGTAAETIGNPISPTLGDDHPKLSRVAPNWEDAVALPASMDAALWSGWIVENLISRLGSADLALEPSLRSLVALPPEVLIDSLPGNLPGYLREHASDAYRLLVLREPRDVMTDEPGETVGRETFKLLADAGLNALYQCSVSSSVLDLELGVVRHALVIAGERDQMILGPFYSMRVLRAAAEYVLPDWVSKTKARHEVDPSSPA